MKKPRYIIGFVALACVLIVLILQWNGFFLITSNRFIQDGVVYILPGPKIEFSSTPASLMYRTRYWCLEVRHGEILLDESSYGIVVPGDRVQVSRGGLIIVNEILREKKQ
jgi:hypothetical protein